MIALAAPLALLGLLAVPAVLWLARRRRPPPQVLVPSLLFLEPEAPEPALPERPRLDLDAWLAAATVALLSLAAAGPSWASGRPGRTVRVVVDEGEAMAARSADGSTAATRAEAAVDAMRAALGAGDRLVRVPARAPGLLEQARRGEASLRVVVTDRDLAGAAPDVRVVAVGDPQAENAGVLSVRVAEEGAERSVFVLVGNASTRDRSLRVQVDAAVRAVEVPAGGAQSLTVRGPIPVPPEGAARAAQIVLEDPSGALEADDRVVVSAQPLVVAIFPPPVGPTPAHAEVVRAALDAVLPGRWTPAAHEAVRADLWVGDPARARPDAGLVLALHPVPPGVVAEHAAPGAALEPPDPRWGRDLDPAGCELVYDPAVASGPPWPLVRVRPATDAAATVVEWMPDPVAGTPPPAAHAVWPLFVDNLVASLRGREAPGGWRARGVLDAEATFVGRDRAAFDPDWLGHAPPDRQPRVAALAAPLVWIALGVLAVLWLRPRRAARPV